MSAMDWTPSDNVVIKGLAMYVTDWICFGSFVLRVFTLYVMDLICSDCVVYRDVTIYVMELILSVDSPQGSDGGHASLSISCQHQCDSMLLL